MRYATFSLSDDPMPRLGAVIGDRMMDVSAALSGRWKGEPPFTLLALIEAGPDAWARAREALPTATQGHALDAVRWHAPIPRPSKNVFCVGRNYAAHVKEGALARQTDAKLPTVPVFFTKAPTAVRGPYDDLPLHRHVTAQLDWEVELGVIVGTTCRDLTAATALDRVFGYTVVNDITARDLQQQHTQWFKGKSLDGSCPTGPVVVTADEFGDPQQTRVSLRINGVIKQDAATSDMIFPVVTILEFLSKGMTLEPGDLIATGTPEGVGMGRTPQEWLQDGDVVEAEVQGIGMLRNRIVDR